MNNTITTCSFITSNLPEDILTYTEDKFYNFVKELLGQSAADLLAIQAINNVPSFLLSDDVCDIIENAVESEEIDALRKKVSFANRDGTYHVKIGIRNNFKYLNKLLSAKLEEENNKKKRNLQKATRKINSPSSSLSSQLSTETNSTSSQLTTETNSTSSQLTTDTNSTSPPSKTTDTNSTSPPSKTTDTNSTSPPSKTTSNSRLPPLTTKEEHIEFILNLMKKWTENSKENLHLNELELKPEVDYIISITNNNNVFEGVMRCKCGVRIRLRKRDGRFQITNFYKHLRSATCSMMKEKKNQDNQQKALPNGTSDNDNNNTDDNQSTASSSITPRQPLSDIISDVPAPQSQRTNIISLSTASGAKRNSSSLKATNSQQSSAKRHKK